MEVEFGMLVFSYVFITFLLLYICDEGNLKKKGLVLASGSGGLGSIVVKMQAAGMAASSGNGGGGNWMLRPLSS